MGLDYSKINPAAVFQAYFRTFFAIPHAQAIADAIRAKEQFEQFADDSLSERLLLIPFFEARYRAVDRVLREYLGYLGTRQILDLASGLSPEGLIFCRSFYPLVYVELDLPEMMEYKREIIAKISPQPPAGLHLEAGDCLDYQELKQVARWFNPKQPIIIITRGFFSLLNLAEKAILADNIHELLCTYDGVWITPDLSLHNESRREISLVFPTPFLLEQKPNKAYDRRLENHVFGSESEADEFLSRRGFVVGKEPQLMPGEEPLTIKKLNLPEHQARPILENIKRFGKVWILRARKLAPAGTEIDESGG